MKKSPIFALLLLALPVAAQDLEISPVAGPIHMISGRGGNIGVSAGADGFLMIDDKFADLSDQIRAALKGLGEGELKFLLNTHYHGDHTGANYIFGAETPIIAHHNVRTRLMTESPPATAWPVITFDSALSIHFNGEEVKVQHIPHAHTDGGGSVQGVIAAVEMVLTKTDADTKIIPGHGPLATPADLKTYLRMIKESQATVAAGLKAGKSLEELQAAGVGEEWASWSWGFISTKRWVATLHRSQ